MAIGPLPTGSLPTEPEVVEPAAIGAATAAGSGDRLVVGVSRASEAWRQLRKNRAAMIALVYLLLVATLALATPLLPLASPYRVNTQQVLAPPQHLAWQASAQAAGELEAQTLREFDRLDPISRLVLRARFAVFGERTLTHICGTDELGRDLLARVCWGARVSLLVGMVATFVSLVIGVSYGAIAGYLGGRADSAMMRLVDILYSLPLIFVVIFLMTFLSEPTVKSWLEVRLGVSRMTVFFLVVGAVEWLTMARVVRGQIMSLKEEQFVEAARNLGATRRRIIFRHLVPNLLGVIIVYLTLTIPQVMLFEAFLSFLGLGVQAPDVSWGLLANQGFKVITPVRIFWWLMLYPGLALGTTLLALNFLGDGLRDALDPRMKHR